MTPLGHTPIPEPMLNKGYGAMSHSRNDNRAFFAKVANPKCPQMDKWARLVEHHSLSSLVGCTSHRLPVLFW